MKELETHIEELKEESNTLKHEKDTVTLEHNELKETEAKEKADTAHRV